MAEPCTDLKKCLESESCTDCHNKLVAKIKRLQDTLHDLEAHGGIPEIVQENAATQENNRALTAKVQRLQVIVKQLQANLLQEARLYQADDGSPGPLSTQWEWCDMAKLPQELTKGE